MQPNKNIRLVTPPKEHNLRPFKKTSTTKRHYRQSLSSLGKNKQLSRTCQQNATFKVTYHKLNQKTVPKHRIFIAILSRYRV